MQHCKNGMILCKLVGHNIFKILSEVKKDKWNLCSVSQCPADIGLFVVCSPDDALLAFLDASIFLIAFSKVEDGYNCHMLSLYGTVIVLSSTANTGTGRTLIYCCHYLLYRCIQSRCVQTHPLIICCIAAKLPWPCTKWLHAFINVSSRSKLLCGAALVMGIVFYLSSTRPNGDKVCKVRHTFELFGH